MKKQKSKKPPSPRKYKSGSFMIGRRWLTAFASLSIPLLTSSCAMQPLPPPPERQLIACPDITLKARPVPSWAGGDYGALADYALQLFAVASKSEVDKAACRNFIAKEQGK